MTQSPLFQKNVEILKPYLRPQIIETLFSIPNNIYEVIGSAESGNLNFVSSEQKFYEPNAIVSSYLQVQSYIENPQQIRLTDNLDIPIQQNNLAAEFNNGLMQDTMDLYPLESPKYNEVAYLICLGIGAGFHLPFLVSAFNFKEIIFLEPDFYLFMCSLNSYDWAPIVEQIERRKGRITFLFEEEPAIAYTTITGFMRDRHYGLIEGSYIFQHYEHATFTELRKRISHMGPDLLNYNGWLEDEMLHLKNHITNFAHKKFQLLENAPSQLNKELGIAAIVGSGPSLNDSIDTLLKHRENITIFSCGTSIGPLLTHGIQPDFHCELENVSIVYDFILQLSQNYSLDNTTLIASSTMNPDAASLFKKGIFFIREGYGTMSAISQGISQLDNVGPSGTNTAIRVATQIGFSSICLFGTDFGALHKDQEYAKGVVYKDLKKINEARTSLGENPLPNGGSAFRNLETMIEGNFGNIISTNAVLLGMKNRLETSVLQSESQIFNCSNGAKIQGTLACDTKNFRELLTKFPKNSHFSPSTLPIISPVELEKIQTVNFELTRHFSELSNKLQNFIQTQESSSRINDLYTIFSEHMYFELSEKGNSTHDAIKGALSGSLMQIYHVIRYYYCRVGTSNDDFLNHAASKFKKHISLFQANSSGFIKNTLATLHYTDEQGFNNKDNFAIYFVQGRSNTKWKYTENIKNFFYKDDIKLTDLLDEIIDDDEISNYILTYLFVYIANNQELHNKSIDEQARFLYALIKRIKNPSSRLLGAAATYFCFSGKMNIALELTNKTLKTKRFPVRNIWYANMLLLNGNAKESIRIFNELPQYENLPNIINLMPLNLYVLEQKTDAFDCLEKQLSNPDATGASVYFKSFLMDEIGEHENAKKLLKSANDSYPNWGSRAQFIFDTVLDKN